MEDQERHSKEIEAFVEAIPKLPISSDLTFRIFANQHQEMLNNYVLEKMRVAVLGDQPEAVLFRLGESDLIVMIEFDDYGIQLQALKEYYMRNEVYEKVSICHKLLIKHHINKVIEDSIQM